MKKWFIVLFIVLCSGCNSQDELSTAHKGIQDAIVERSYVCVELGYNAAKSGLSLDQAYSRLEAIDGIGPRLCTGAAKPRSTSE